MAGHSKFKNIMHRKGAQDQKRAKLFTRATREIIIAAKNGDDPSFNPRLRLAIATAKKLNLPKDKIEGAIKKASAKNAAENFEEIRYEGYGPNGIAVIVESVTDNKNRTASEVRSTFSKYGGALGEHGSVSYMFKKLGLIIYSANKVDKEAVIEKSIELGAEDCVEQEKELHVICAMEEYSDINEKLLKEFGDPLESMIAWIPEIKIAAEDEEKAQKLLVALDDLEDVQAVHSNLK